jgi:hypothetical protein
VDVSVEGIPTDVAEFVGRHIDSVVQLEVLLLLHARRTEAWRPGDVARELRIDPEWTSAAFTKLEAAGVLDVTASGHRYHPRPESLDQTVAALARCYEQRRVSTISLIFSKPPADPVRQFTDAFRIRQDKPKDQER